MLRQLVAWLGDEAFLAGVSDFAAHRFGNGDPRRPARLAEPGVRRGRGGMVGRLAAHDRGRHAARPSDGRPRDGGAGRASRASPAPADGRPVRRRRRRPDQVGAPPPRPGDPVRRRRLGARARRPGRTRTRPAPAQRPRPRLCQGPPRSRVAGVRARSRRLRRRPAQPCGRLDVLARPGARRGARRSGLPHGCQPAPDRRRRRRDRRGSPGVHPARGHRPVPAGRAARGGSCDAGPGLPGYLPRHPRCSRGPGCGSPRRDSLSAPLRLPTTRRGSVRRWPPERFPAARSWTPT